MKKKGLKEAIDTALKEDAQLIIEATLVGMEISVGAYSLDDRGNRSAHYRDHFGKRFF